MELHVGAKFSPHNPLFSDTETIDKVVNTDEDKSKTRVITPATQTRKSLRRIEPGKKSVGKTATGKSEERLVNSDYGMNLQFLL